MKPAEDKLINKFGELKSNFEKTILEMAATVASEYHEKWNGTGCQNKLKVEEIHIYGRIIALDEFLKVRDSKI